ncbi:hypothetical protein FA95DRAFT_1262649 [Auriscalpium vulgare]|uniref:Uncharacterized protein n=1 Tax=Auriscalpium vulgare TaxID=40419 RepID=A0ACB8RSX7_9AGAM|nr:hypothetical protein FA95DRAFT_1262649 [Auriscalpium vulgare]
MPKPTLLQSLLGRPSQSYAFPPDNARHSARPHFVRAAAPANPIQPPSSPDDHHGSDDSGDADGDGGGDGDSLYFTPLSSPDPAAMAVLPDEPSSSDSSDSSAVSYSTSPTSDDTHRLVPPTHQAWSKEVRWLVPSAVSSKRPAVSQHHAGPPQLPQPPPRKHHRSRTSSGRTRATKVHMTALLEEDEDVGDAAAPARTPSLTRPRTSVSRSNSLTASARPSSRSSHSRATSFTSYSSKPTSRTVELPAPLPEAPTPAHGYTTLTLPRATYKPSDPWQTLGGGRIDLAREGRAQGTMASIEVVAGLSRGKRGSTRRTRELSSALALSAHLPPPSFVRNSHVLVQVYAIGLEELDKTIVQEKVCDGKSAGFVPGRSVVGRVVECGWEVRGEVVNKGDWVVGMLDVKKVRFPYILERQFVDSTHQCGALAEFVLLDRHRVQRVPQPMLPSPTLFPSALPPPVIARRLTLEALALLPALGVPAHRAVRTYTASLPSLASDGGLRGTAVVLRAEDGVGGLATLMLCALGVRVLAHIDPSVFGLPEPSPEDQPLLLWGVADDARAARGNSCFNEVCGRLRQAGVAGICVGSPTDVLARLAEMKGDVDFVLDTVGGRVVWAAAQAILARAAPGRGDAQFTTVVGEGHAIPSAQDHWRAGVRSWRRAIGPGTTSTSSSSSSTSPSSESPPKEKKGRRKEKPRPVAYSWVSCVADVDFEGGDVREALGAVLGLVESGVVRLDQLIGGAVYGAGRVLPFERAHEAFGGAILEGGGTAVVRVVV